MSAPERIWAKLDRATVYMDGSSPLVASTREFNGAAEYVTVSTQNTGNLNRTRPDGWLVIGPADDKRVVLDAMKYNPTDPAFWYGGQIPDDASIHPLFASADAVAGDLLVAVMPDEDDIEQAITDSMDLDWTPRDAAKAVMRLLNTGVNGEGSEGEHLERCCPFDPNSDPKNENIDASTFNLVLSALTDLVRYLSDTSHRNSPQAAAARYAIRKAGG